MKVIRIKGKIDKDGHLKIDIPTAYKAGDVEIVMAIEKSVKSNNKYSFSDLSGNLIWKGDPLSAQRIMRNEWE